MATKPKISYEYVQGDARNPRGGSYVVATMRRGRKTFTEMGRSKRAAEARVRRGAGLNGG